MFFIRLFQVGLFISLICATNAHSFAQCGTVIPRNHITNPPIASNGMKSMVSYDLNKTLSVNIYVVASAYETYDYGAGDYAASWDELNLLFAPINVQFQICSETLIPNYNYNILNRIPDPDTDLSEQDEMFAQYYVENTINVYYVQTIDTEPDVAGYASFPGGADYIVMTKGAGQWVLPHEMGHFFGLYHTFETELGTEFVNGANCVSTGDLVCDTPADNQGPLDGCQYSAYIEDVNGDPYIPHINNIMSYYPDECICQFTAGQYNRMAAQYLSIRNYLW